MSVNFTELNPSEDYLLVEKVTQSESDGGILLIENVIKMAKIKKDGPDLGREGLVAILQAEPEHDVGNGLFFTHKTNVVGTAKIKE